MTDTTRWRGRYSTHVEFVNGAVLDSTMWTMFGVRRALKKLAKRDDLVIVTAWKHSSAKYREFLVGIADFKGVVDDEL